MNVKDPKTLVRVGLVGTVLVALCCFTPILVILLGVNLAVTGLVAFKTLTAKPAAAHGGKPDGDAFLGHGIGAPDWVSRGWPRSAR